MRDSHGKDCISTKAIAMTKGGKVSPMPSCGSPRTIVSSL